MPLGTIYKKNIHYGLIDKNNCVQVAVFSDLYYLHYDEVLLKIPMLRLKLLRLW